MLLGDEPGEQRHRERRARLGVARLAEADDRSPLGEAAEGTVIRGGGEDERPVEQHDDGTFVVERCRPSGRAATR